MSVDFRRIDLQIDHHADVLGLYKAKVYRKGQVFVPEVCRQHMGIHPKDNIFFYFQTDGTIILMSETMARERLEPMEIEHFKKITNYNYEKVFNEYFGEELDESDSEI